MAAAPAGHSVPGIQYPRRNPVSTILIGVDDSTRSEDAVAFARRLAGATTAASSWPARSPTATSPSRAANLTYRQALKDDATATRARMSRLLELPDERVGVSVIADPSPARALHAAAEAERARRSSSSAIRIPAPPAGSSPGRPPSACSTGRRAPWPSCPTGTATCPGARPARRRRLHGHAPRAWRRSPPAAAAARALHARLEVIGVAPPRTLRDSADAGGPSSSQMRAEAAGHAQASSRRSSTSCATRSGPRPSLEGDPAEQLAAHSASLDLLVMGSRGYGPLRAVLAGGVSGRVTREATARSSSSRAGCRRRSASCSATARRDRLSRSARDGALGRLAAPARDAGVHRRALAGLRGDLERAVDERDALAHPDQAEPVASAASASKPATVVAQDDLERSRSPSVTRTSTRVASACLTTFVSASWTSR